MKKFLLSALLNLRKRLRGVNPDCEQLLWDVDHLVPRSLFHALEPGDPVPHADPDDPYVILIHPDLEHLASALEARDIPGAILHVEAALLALYS